MKKFTLHCSNMTCARILYDQARPQRLTNGHFKARLFASNIDERFGYEFSSKRSAARDGGRYNAGGSYDVVARWTGWFNDRGARPREAHWSAGYSARSRSRRDARRNAGHHRPQRRRKKRVAQTSGWIDETKRGTNLGRSAKHHCPERATISHDSPEDRHSFSGGGSFRFDDRGRKHRFPVARSGRARPESAPRESASNARGDGTGRRGGENAGEF